MPLINKMPRMLKSPTGWVLLVLLLGFFYMQWPTHVRQSAAIEGYWQTLPSGLMVRWEQQPSLQSANQPTVWGLTRKRMSFLVQTDHLTIPFDKLVHDVAARDQQLVGGAVQEPLRIGPDWASYAFFDAENRIQRHRWFLQNGQWIKVSVLYSPSMESRVERANAFLNSLQFKTDASADSASPASS